MAVHGPVPKRESQRRRRNASDPVTVATAGGKRDAPAGDPSWHPLALEWYSALAASGQAAFYEASDWSTARVWAELLSRQLNSARMSAQMVTAWASASTELLTTEGARRRVRLELDRRQGVDSGDDHADATVTDLLVRLGKDQESAERRADGPEGVRQNG